MKPTVRALTLVDAEYIAARACASHRSDILREFPSMSDWARNRVNAKGSAYVLAAECPIIAGGVESFGAMGLLWLAGIDGWTMYVRHAIRLWRIALTSGAYNRYECEVHEADPIARQFAERLGFRQLDAKDGIVLYGVTP